MTAYPHHPNSLFSQAGFTLVELLMALAIAALAMSAVLMADMGQHQSYNAQSQIADARQKARALISILRSDLLMTQTFNIAQAATMALTREDGVAVTYTWTANDTNGNGIGLEVLRQVNGGQPEVFTEGIDGFEFYYDLMGATQINNVNPAQLNAITSVTISLVSRADGPDPHYQNTDNYRNMLGRDWPQPNLNHGPPNDNFHRRFWQETVTCRNMVP